jgi:hypothetical protein
MTIKVQTLDEYLLSDAQDKHPIGSSPREMLMMQSAKCYKIAPLPGSLAHIHLSCNPFLSI